MSKTNGSFYPFNFYLLVFNLCHLVHNCSSLTGPMVSVKKQLISLLQICLINYQAAERCWCLILLLSLVLVLMMIINCLQLVDYFYYFGLILIVVDQVAVCWVDTWKEINLIIVICYWFKLIINFHHFLFFLIRNN